MKIKTKDLLLTSIPFFIIGTIVALFIFLYGYPNYQFKKAENYLKNKQYSQAIDIYKKHFKKLDMEKKFLLAKTYAFNEDIDSSLNIYNQIIEDKSTSNVVKSKIYTNMASLYVEQNNIEKALEYYKNAIKTSEPYSEVQLNLKKMYGFLISDTLIEEYKEEGIDVLSDLIRTDTEKNNPEVYHRIGLIFKSKGEYELAVESFNMAIEKDHKFTPAYNSLGFIFLEIDNLDLASKYFSKSITYDTRNGETYYGLAQCYEYKKMFKDAIFNYRQAKLYSPSDIGSRLGLARIFIYIKDKQSACAELLEIIKLVPNTEYAKEAKKILEEIAPKLYLPPERLNGVEK